MKKEKLHEKNISELHEMLGETRRALRTFRFNIAGSQIRDVREGRALRKRIARLETERTARTSTAPIS